MSSDEYIRRTRPANPIRANDAVAQVTAAFATASQTQRTPLRCSVADAGPASRCARSSEACAWRSDRGCVATGAASTGSNAASKPIALFSSSDSGRRRQSRRLRQAEASIDDASGAGDFRHRSRSTDFLRSRRTLPASQNVLRCLDNVTGRASVPAHRVTCIAITSGLVSQAKAIETTHVHGGPTPQALDRAGHGEHGDRPRPGHPSHPFSSSQDGPQDEDCFATAAVLQQSRRHRPVLETRRRSAEYDRRTS
ncbi:hypothetical protein GLA29479_2301 [Lysobacter antibioticus]|nr:hypothetical protein GLA29479_2301 [Lysobacter antibioticus]